jgi:predicted nucleic acid-binding protein|tara:strand:- start:457 stop:846 length:390 start_codon:yes stop_codon:yes gene_type:complete
VIVVDTNILEYLLIQGEHSERVEQLLIEDSDWVAPRLWLDEFLNVLATIERVGKMESQEADGILSDAIELMEDRSYDVPAQRVLATARRTGCSAYDSQFLTLAEDLGLKLYSFDQKLINRSGGVAVKPE